MLNQFEELRDTLYKFLETRIDLLEVQTRGYLERIILKLVYVGMVLMAVVIVVVFLLLLLAVYLNFLLQSAYAGYLIIAVFFGLTLAILVTMRKRSLKLIRWVLEKSFKDDDQELIN